MYWFLIRSGIRLKLHQNQINITTKSFIQFLGVTFKPIIKPGIKLESSSKLSQSVASLAKLISNLKVKANPITRPRPISHLSFE